MTDSSLLRLFLEAPSAELWSACCFVLTETPRAVPGAFVQVMDDPAEENSAHLLDGDIRLGLSTVEVESVSGPGERYEKRHVEEVAGDCVDGGAA